MSQALIDPNNHEEQLYYPLEYLNISNNDYFEQDDYFIDKTASNDIKESNTKCKETRIVRTDIGAFTIREIFLAKWLLFGYFIFPIICITVFLIYKGIELISFIFAILILLCSVAYGIYTGISFYYSIHLLLKPNSITLTKKALFKKKVIIYNIDELEKAEICYKYISKIYTHRFVLYFVRTSGEKEEFHSINSDKSDVDLKGIKYFIDLINTHIQKKMKS